MILFYKQKKKTDIFVVWFLHGNTLMILSSAITNSSKEICSFKVNTYINKLIGTCPDIKTIFHPKIIWLLFRNRKTSDTFWRNWSTLSIFAASFEIDIIKGSHFKPDVKRKPKILNCLATNSAEDLCRTRHIFCMIQ